MMRPELLDRLRGWSEWIGNYQMPPHHAENLKADLAEAITEIEHLRGIAGAVSKGASLAEIRATLNSNGPKD